MTSPRVCCQMIIGPGESTRYLDRVLRHARDWADELVVYGDRCDPDTWDAIQHWATGCLLVDADGFHESRARNGALELCDTILAPGDLVVVLDADEELRTIDGDHPRGVLDRFAGDVNVTRWPVLFWHLWNPEGSLHRVDPLWQPSVGYRAYRHEPGLRLPDRRIGVPPVPDTPMHAPSTVELGIAHWGYARPHDRERKHAYYMREDGGRYHLLSHLESIITEPVLNAVPGACLS